MINSSKEIIKKLNEIYIKSNNIKSINNSSEIEYIKRNFVRLNVKSLIGNKDNVNDNEIIIV